MLIELGAESGEHRGERRAGGSGSHWWGGGGRHLGSGFLRGHSVCRVGIVWRRKGAALHASLWAAVVATTKLLFDDGEIFGSLAADSILRSGINGSFFSIARLRSIPPKLVQVLWKDSIVNSLHKFPTTIKLSYQENHAVQNLSTRKYTQNKELIATSIGYLLLATPPRKLQSTFGPLGY